MVSDRRADAFISHFGINDSLVLAELVHFKIAGREAGQSEQRSLTCGVAPVRQKHSSK
jgi:hypothetical protein